jgi:hypothetical protein
MQRVFLRGVAFTSYLQRSHSAVALMFKLLIPCEAAFCFSYRASAPAEPLKSGFCLKNRLIHTGL